MLSVYICRPNRPMLWKVKEPLLRLNLKRRTRSRVSSRVTKGIFRESVILMDIAIILTQ